MNMYLVINRPEMDQKLPEVVIRYQKLWITNSKILMNNLVTKPKLALYEINILEEGIFHLLIVEYYCFKQQNNSYKATHSWIEENSLNKIFLNYHLAHSFDCLLGFLIWKYCLMNFYHYHFVMIKYHNPLICADP